jgi:hypothetical protein
MSDQVARVPMSVAEVTAEYSTLGLRDEATYWSVSYYEPSGSFGGNYVSGYLNGTQPARVLRKRYRRSGKFSRLIKQDETPHTFGS